MAGLSWLQWTVVLVVATTVIVAGIAASFRSSGKLTRSISNLAAAFSAAIWFIARWLIRGVQVIQINGHRFSPRKDALVGPIADHLIWYGLTPDRQTLLRGLLFGAVLVLIGQAQFAWAFGLYVAAWILDLTDGATARRYPNAVTPYGKYLDPVIDTAGIFLIAVRLRPHFIHDWVPLALISLIGLRIALYICFWVWWAWRLRLGILPKTISGEYKALFIAVGFGLILWRPNSPVTASGAELCLVLATVFEAQSLLALGKCFRQKVADYRSRPPFPTP